MFLISTPDDRGQSGRHIQTINAHSAHIKHNSVASALRETASMAPIEQRATRSASRLQPPRVKSHTLSTLDPFIRLPIAITRYERGLLHYCLTHGERVNAVPVSQHVFDPTIYAASHLLHADKMYILVHLAMGEWMICQRRRVAVSALAYHWRIQAYRYMSELLVSSESPFLIQISGLFQLALMEQVFRELPLQERHLRALHNLIETHGGLQRLKSASTGSGPNPGVSFVTSFFTFAEMLLTNSVAFDSVVGRFGHNLKILSTIHRSLVYNETICLDNETSLIHLRVYVDRLLSAYLSQSSTPYRLRAGAFGFIFSLGMSLAVYRLSAASSFHFLIRLEQCMLASMNILSPCADLLCPIESIPCSAIWLLGYVRSCSLHMLEEKETEISQSLLDMLRLLRYISGPDIMWLAVSLTQGVFGTIGRDAPVFPEAKVESLIRGLRESNRRPNGCVA